MLTKHLTEHLTERTYCKETAGRYRQQACHFEPSTRYHHRNSRAPQPKKSTNEHPHVDKRTGTPQRVSQTAGKKGTSPAAGTWERSFWASRWGQPLSIQLWTVALQLQRLGDFGCAGQGIGHGVHHERAAVASITRHIHRRGIHGDTVRASREVRALDSHHG